MLSTYTAQRVAPSDSPAQHLHGDSKVQERRSVLLIEDEDGHAHLVRRALSKCHCHFEVERVTSLADAITSLTSRTFDVLLCDLTLPDSQGADTVKTIRRSHSDIPVVILTSLASERMANLVLEHGAQDYLLKDILVSDSCGAEVVERAIRHAIYRQRVAAEMQKLYRHSRHHQKSLQEKNARLAQLYKVAQTVVENVSHEFRTPLTVIKEYAALLHEGTLGAVTQEQGHFLDVISDRAEDLNRMVDDMLDVSKLDSGLLTVRRTECNIADVVRHVTLPLKRKAALKGVTLSVEFEEHLPTVYCDADKAGRTIINLVVNAIKFCREPGVVTLSAHFDQQAQELVIKVTDNGPGIEEEDLKRLFTRFTQVDVALSDGTKGFGLGLSIAKEMVELNLGRIAVTSHVGFGSTFSFTIPRANPVEIARRYLLRLNEQATAPSVLLCVIRATNAGTEGSNDIDPLLYYVLRANDLVFRVRADRWLVLMACDEKGFETFQKRLQKVVKQMNRNRIHQPLPPLDSEFAGRWEVQDDREAILAEVHRRVQDGEAIYAQTS